MTRQAEWPAAYIRKEAVTSLGYEKWLSTYLLEHRATRRKNSPAVPTTPQVVLETHCGTRSHCGRT